MNTLRSRSGLLACTVLALMLAGCGSPGDTPGAELTPAPSADTPDPSKDLTESSTEPSASTTGTETPMPSETAKPSPSFPSDPAAVGTAMLTITIQQTPESAPTEYVLECTKEGVGPATTIPNAEAACETVKSLGADFFTATPDPNRMCTQQYGGPQTATVKGMVDGRRIMTSFSATDGCEIARWNALDSILGTSGAR